MVFQVQQLLEQKGIHSFVKNEFSIGAVGELSTLDVMPEVWVSDQEWLPKAEQFIADFQVQKGVSGPWVCQQCKEKNDASFEVCWQCGADSTY